MMRPCVRTAVTLAAVCVAILVSSAVATTAGASSGVVLSNPVPADGATQTAPGITIDAQSDVALSSATMTIDGSSVSCVLDYAVLVPGYWEWDDYWGEEYWVPPVYDYTRATVRHTGGAPVNGSHTVSVTVTDADSMSATHTWSFTAAVPPEITSLTPANGSTITTTARPTVSAVVYSYTPSFASTMTIDGAKVTTTWIAGSRLLRYVPTTDLSEGTHTASVTIEDATGLVTTKTWQFTVDAIWPPIISSPTPVGGTVTINARPALSVGITVCTPGFVSTMTVDGARVAATWNAGTKRLSYTPASVLSDGTHVIGVEVRDDGGRVSSLSWNVTVDAVPNARFFNRIPASGATVTSWSPPVSVEVTDTYQLSASQTAKMDGAAVTASAAYYVVVPGYWDWDEEDMWWVPPVLDRQRQTISFTKPNLTDGVHTVEVRASNTFGHTAVDTWTFTVAAPPIVGQRSPAPGSITNDRTPLISAVYTENGPAPTATMTVDGVPVPATVTPTAVEYTPVEPLVDEKSYEVVVTITDAAGNPTTTSWTFEVQQYDQMPQGECVTCHVGYPTPNHPIDDCWACHGSESHGEGHECWDCHGHNTLVLQGRPCTLCHTPSRPDVPQHPVDFAASHTTSRDMSQCRPCHVAQLDREHYRYYSDGSTRNDCQTCHDSTDPSVQDAIASGSTACEDCHGMLSDFHPVHRSDLGGQMANGERACTDCHDADLAIEHLKATAGDAAACFTCHDVAAEPAAPSPLAPAAWDATCDTSACHAEDGTGAAAPVHTTYCLGCHEVGNPGFASVATEVDFSVAGVDRAACESCHWADRHWTHGSNKEACTCHSWGYPATRDLYVASVSTPFGWFTDAASPDEDAATIHDIHVTGSWPAARTKTTDGLPACVSCHAPAACEACHTEEPAHGGHGASDGANAPVPARVTAGAPAGTPAGTDTSYLASASCTVARCHARSAADLARATAVVPHTAATVTNAYRAPLYTQLYKNGTATFTVTGAGDLTLAAYAYGYGGIARVTVDGGAPVLVDTYAASGCYNAPSVLARDLPPGTHTVVVENTGARNPLSRGNNVCVMSVRATSAGTPGAFVPACSTCHADKVADHGQ